jgi:hypothetical protein
MNKIATIRYDGRYYIGLGACRSRTEYKTHRGALAAAKRKGYEVTDLTDPAVAYRANANKTKIVTSLQSGKLVRIAVNTPLSCDPSSETYWSM